MTFTRAKLSWLSLLAVVCVAGTGCGSVSKLVGGKKGRTGAQQSPTRSSQLVSSFTAKADPRTGELSFQAVEAASAATTGGVHQQATAYTRAHDLSFSGRALYSNKVLSGDVTLSSASETTFQNVKVIVTSISASDVSVKNGSGVTDLTGTNKPFWAFGNLPGNAEVVRNWQFNVPSGVSFTFGLAVYADVWNTPPGDGGAINGLTFIGSNPAKGWAVGKGGKILYTDNGGASWTAQTSNVSVDLKDVCFVNSETGWAVGNNGTILATTNGGKTWRQRDSGVFGTALNGIAFTNPSVGYIAGLNGVALRTVDGGNSWSPLQIPDGNYQDVDAVGEKVWIVGDGPFLMTSDNYGDSFAERDLPTSQLPTPQFPSLNYVTCVDFIDGNNGWVGGPGGLLFHTTDGGGIWQRQKLDPSSASYKPAINGVKFTNPSLGWAVAFDFSRGGAVFRTTNGGNTWAQATLPTPMGALQTVAAASSDKAWVGGDGGVVLLATGASSSSGSWSISTTGTKSDLKHVHFPSRTTGYAVGNGGTVLKTTDGGRTWPALPNAPFFDINGVFFISNTTGWIVGTGGGCFKTTDGGQNWSFQDTSASGYQTLNSIYMIDQNNGWVVGQAGTIMVTHNGGGTWEAVTPFQGATDANLYDVRFLPGSQNGYIVGQRGMLLLTQDGGANWAYGYGNTDKDLFGLATAPGGHAWLVGKDGTIRTLANDGNWWGQDPGPDISPLAPPALTGVDFLDANRGFIVGSGGTLLQTTDGGNNWTKIPSATTNNLLGVDFFDEDMGALVGRSGTIKTFR